MPNSDYKDTDNDTRKNGTIRIISPIIGVLTFLTAIVGVWAWNISIKTTEAEKLTEKLIETSEEQKSTILHLREHADDMQVKNAITVTQIAEMVQKINNLENFMRHGKRFTWEDGEKLEQTLTKQIEEVKKDLKDHTAKVNEEQRTLKKEK